MSNYQNNKALAEMFKALSNPHRLVLFHRLMTCCAPGTKCNADVAIKFCVSELGEGLNIAASTLSHHLKALHQARLIHMERNGKNVECWVEPDVLKELSTFFNQS